MAKHDVITLLSVASMSLLAVQRQSQAIAQTAAAPARAADCQRRASLTIPASTVEVAGYAGAISYRSPGYPMMSLAEGLRLGYAVANTDMGTGRVSGSEGAPQLIGHSVRWLDFGLREAQQYPNDYGGILVGAPRHNRARIHTSVL